MSAWARILIQVEMKKRDLGYREFTELLNARFGLKENERNIRNKIARGSFTAAFFLMCMQALDCMTINVYPNEVFSADGLGLRRGEL
jgi:hypothetical protein